MVRSPIGSSDESNINNDDEHYDRPASILPEYSLRSTRKAPDTKDATHAKNRNPPKDETTDGSHEPVTHRTGPELEEEAGQQGAFNPETGEINWDCPCLGGMADGPCGEQFKIAFSCFVFSKEDPKGMDCIDKFKGMQACFQQVLLTPNTEGYSTDLSSIQHPEVYGSELDGDEGDEDDEDNEGPTDQTERPNSTDIDSTEIPNTTTTNPTDSSQNQADTPINPVAGKSHSAEPIAHPELTASAKQGVPAPPASAAKSDPIADVTKEDELVAHEVSPHSKPGAGDPERKGGNKT